ncbi:MAG TPA: GyrI-like domain-containing protein [Candidatus Limnocylindrales bacterium]
MVAPTVIPNVPVLGESSHRHVLFQHFVVPLEDLPQTIGKSFSTLYGRITQAGVIPAGPPFVIYHNMAAPWDIDVCAPVATPLTPTPEFEVKELPATRVVSLLHVGPYETIGTAYEAVDAYIRAHSLTPAGPPREIYLSPPETPPELIQTIIEWPIA